MKESDWKSLAFAVTVRQQQVMDGIIDGLSDKEISSRIGVSEHRVDNILRRWFKLLNVRNRTALAVAYMRTRRV